MNILYEGIPIYCDPLSKGFMRALKHLVESNHKKYRTIDINRFTEITKANYVDEILLLWALDTLINFKSTETNVRRNIKKRLTMHLKHVENILNDDLLNFHHKTKTYRLADTLSSELRLFLSLYDKGRGNCTSDYRNAALWYLIKGRKRKNSTRVLDILSAIGCKRERSALKSFKKRHHKKFTLSK